ncbi:MAG: glycosyltransferase family 4 protein [Thermoanaerobaculaceae bacterium]|nr:glycosyltransferase family 4 protein [Thermoanaerobaculaceae bacterium]
MGVRVGFLTERMLLGFGVDLVVHETARRLMLRGFEPTVFTTRSDETYRDAPYPIVDLSARVGSDDVFSPSFMLASLEVLQSAGMEAWVVETPPFYDWFEHLPAPVVCVEHGTPPGSFFPRRLGRRIEARRQRRFEDVYGNLRPGDGVVAISEYIRSGLPPEVAGRAVVIHNGGDHYPLATAEAARALRRRCGVGEDEVVVLWVGRAELHNDLQPYKGFRELLALAPAIASRVRGVRVVALGRGDDAARGAMERAGITPLFHLPAQDMAAALRGADVLVSTSRWEGFNLPLVEAQFQGTPVVAYRLCAHPEVVRDGESGILVATREELLSAVVRLASDAEVRRRLAEGARAAVARFTWDAAADRLATYLQRCLAEARRHPLLPPTPPVKDRRYYLKVARRILRREGIVVLLRESLSALRKRARHLLSSRA